MMIQSLKKHLGSNADAIEALGDDERSALESNLGTLRNRVEALKRRGGLFAAISVSDDVRALLGQVEAIPA
jgi:hypothetical protein